MRVKSSDAERPSSVKKTVVAATPVVTSASLPVVPTKNYSPLLKTLEMTTAEDEADREPPTSQQQQVAPWDHIGHLPPS
jgi:hypothetical protein